MNKPTFQNVTEMVSQLTSDPSLTDQLAQQIANRKVVKQLIALRCARGLSQADVATSMHCTQSKISKLESGLDQDLRLGDLESYLHALGLQPRLHVQNACADRGFEIEATSPISIPH